MAKIKILLKIKILFSPKGRAKIKKYFTEKEEWAKHWESQTVILAVIVILLSLFIYYRHQNSKQKDSKSSAHRVEFFYFFDKIYF